MARQGSRGRAGRFGGAAGRFAWLTVLTLWGCTSVDSAADRQIAEQRLPRPAAIVVHDFAVAPEEVDPGQPLGGARLVQDTARTQREEAVGHAFADEFSVALVEEIRKLGLPAQRAAAPNLPSGDVVTIEGRFISLAGDPSAPGIVGFSGDWPNVLADVQLYGTDSSGEKLSEDIEVSLSQGGESYPAALLPDPTITAGQAVTTPGLSPAERAKLQTAAREAAGTVAGQLKSYFAGQGWIAAAQS
jgi:Domain of unknown function (DUF4410)